MKAAGSRLWISVCSALVVCLAAVVKSDRAMPGPLSGVHERIPELAESGSCAECHGGWFSNMTDSCMECHQSIRSDIEINDGLHGSLERDQAMACAACHSEHHGSSFALVNEQSFARGGIDDADAFDHVLVGFVMDGAHDELSCAECHEHADDRVLPEGAFRFGGLEQRCDACHEPAHEERLNNSCADCHDQSDFSRPNPTGHDRHLPLIGGHESLGCRDCHDLEGSHRLGVRAAVQRSCSDCHDPPHSAAFNEAVAPATVAGPSGNACRDCHAADHDTFLDATPELTAEQHSRSGFPLDAPHESVDCEDCHGENGGPYAERFATPGRDRGACQLCHDDPHGGQFAPFIQAQHSALNPPCLFCHQQSGFAPNLFDSARHQTTAFPLIGQHLEAECRACHVLPGDSDVRHFVETSARCDSCHDDAHRGAFATQQDCSDCHDSTGFDLADHERFDHSRWTGFALQGAHSQTDCASCHPRSPTADKSGRRFGRIADHVSSPRACGSCHGNPHEGRYNGPDTPADIDGRSGCLRCHTANSFRSLREDYDHGLWTGFEIVGHHAEADCSGCHQAQDNSTSSLTGHANWGTPRGNSCADCHTSPHAGQFGTGAAASCERCHAGARGFSDLSFDHDSDSRFPLTATHRALSCDACHDTVSAGSVDVVRYLPLPTACVDCHGIHEDVLLRRREDLR